MDRGDCRKKKKYKPIYKTGRLLKGGKKMKQGEEHKLERLTGTITYPEKLVDKLKHPKHKHKALHSKLKVVGKLKY